MDRATFLAPSDDLIALILAQAAQAPQISALTALVAELKAKLAAPNTPDVSRLPPSKGQKANCPTARRSRAGVTPVSPARWPETLTACSRRHLRPVRTAPIRSQRSTSPTFTPMTPSTCRRPARWSRASTGIAASALAAASVSPPRCHGRSRRACRSSRGCAR